MPILVLQLSDFHIKHPDDPVLQRVDAIVAAIRGHSVTPSACLVAVPGDVSYSGKPQEYKAAEEFFRELLSRLEQTYPGVHPEIVFAPGNHDCDMTLAADVRQRDLIRGILPAVDINGAVAGHYLAVQTPFFHFARQFGQLHRNSTEQLSVRREFVSARSARIAFTLYNTAWLSQDPEKPGTLFFPVAVLSPSIDATADVEIAMFHHPYNWLEPRNAMDFQHFVESRSDIVLTGHEHLADSYAKQRAAGTVQLVAGQAMFDTREANNGFNLILVHLSSKKWQLTAFNWDGKAFLTAGPAGHCMPFLRNKQLADAGFQNNPDFADTLTDLGTLLSKTTLALR
ncbi:MAG: metallophosphoesterase [Bryobacteraceae bacterium]